MQECNPQGIKLAVIDDANAKVFLYGNVVFENNHVPKEDCGGVVAVAVAVGDFGANYKDVQEVINGEVPGGEYTINAQVATIQVYRNGLYLLEGNEYDYTLIKKGTSTVVKFNKTIHWEDSDVTVYKYRKAV